MHSISIASRLWFTETVLGATLNFRASDEPNAVLFRVGISFDSLRQCHRSLSRSACLWTIKDGTLTVYGDTEQITLTFVTAQGEFYQGSISLYGEELEAFKSAIDSFAARETMHLN
jgi:hypothetical protein